MAHLIDKSAVVAEIERRIKTNKECMLGLRNLDYYQGKVDALSDTISFLDSIEGKDVDLDFQRFAKEMDAIFALPSSKTKNTEEEPLNWEYAIAKYFFELGLKSKSSYVDIPNIDDTLKEMGVDPDSKEANNFKNCYYMALEKLKEKKNDVYEHNNDIYSTKQREAREV